MRALNAADGQPQSTEYAALCVFAKNSSRRGTGRASVRIRTSEASPPLGPMTFSVQLRTKVIMITLRPAGYVSIEFVRTWAQKIPILVDQRVASIEDHAR